MTKEKLIIVLSTFLMVTSLFSQRKWETSAGPDMRNVRFKNGVFNNNLEFFAMAKVNSKNNTDYFKNAEGQYYFKEKWGKCRVITKSNKDYTLNDCNYNIYDKRFEFLIDNNLYFLKKNEVKQIFINKDKFLPFNNQLTSDKNYYQIIHKFNDNLKLIKIFKLKKKNIPSSSSLGIYVNKVERKSQNYLILNNKLIELPRSKKKILKIIGKKYHNKYQNLNIKNDKDLIKLINS